MTGQINNQLRYPSEASIQADFFRWVDLHSKRHPELLLFHSIPNGSHKSPAARGLFRATGLRPGVPDTHLPVATIAYSGLWIEFKAKRGPLSEAQRWWIYKLREAGHRVEICRSWTDAANLTIEYLGLDLAKV